jgi:hypothetical protein
MGIGPQIALAPMSAFKMTPIEIRRKGVPVDEHDHRIQRRLFRKT